MRYIYDSWGNTLSVQDANGKEITDPNHMGNLNPMRYRGYYFDTETGLYYLQSRYYDPRPAALSMRMGMYLLGKVSLEAICLPIAKTTQSIELIPLVK